MNCKFTTGCFTEYYGRLYYDAVIEELRNCDQVRHSKPAPGIEQSVAGIVAMIVLYPKMPSLAAPSLGIPAKPQPRSREVVRGIAFRPSSHRLLLLVVDLSKPVKCRFEHLSEASHVRHPPAITVRS